MRIRRETALHLLVAAWSLAFAVLGLRLYVADSEIWSMSFGGNCRAEWLQPPYHTRPLFHLPFCAISALVADPTRTFLAGRAWHVAVGLLILFSTVVWARREFASVTVGGLAGALLVLNLGFLNQGFRVRADLLASALALAACAFTAYAPRPRRNFLLILLLPALATPKGLLFGFLGAVARYAHLLHPRRFDRRSRITLGAAAVAFAAFNHDNIRYLWRSFSTMLAGGASDAGNSFFFVNAFLARNPIFIALLGLKIFFAYGNLRNPGVPAPEKEREGRWLLVVALWLFTVLIFPERLPYFLAAGLPFLCIFTASLWRDLESRGWRHLGRATAALLLVLQFTAALFFVRNWRDNANKDQFAALDALHLYIERQDTPPVYDVIGLRPRSGGIRFFLGPHEENVNAGLIDELRRRPPELILAVRKLGLAGPAVDLLIGANYLHLGQGVHARALVLEGVPVEEKSARFRELLRERNLESTEVLAYEVLQLSVGGNRREVHRRPVAEIAMMLDPAVARTQTSSITKISRYPQPPELPGHLDELFRFDTAF